MAAIILPDRWGRFPAGEIELNEQHWLVSRGNVLAYAPFSGRHIYLDGRWIAFSDTVRIRADSTSPNRSLVCNFPATTDFITIPTAQPSFPLTMLAWANSSSTTAIQGLITYENNLGSNAFRLSLRGDVTNDPVYAQSGGGSSTQASYVGYTTNTWQLAGAKFISTTNRVAGLNGIWGSADTTSNTPSGITRLKIGSYLATSINRTLVGSIAQALAVNEDLNQADFERLYEEQRKAPWQMLRPRKRILYFSVSSGGQTLTPSLVTNSQTFHAPTVTAGAVTLAPSLVTNNQTFHAATVTAGTVNLTPSLVTNGQTFYAPVVANGGVTLAPSLVTNSQTFPSPTISVGAVTLTLDVVVNGQTFYAPTVAQPSGQTLEPTLVTNGQTFYGPTVEGMLLTQADLDAIAAAVWADPAAVAAHAKLDAIIARITC